MQVPITQTSQDSISHYLKLENPQLLPNLQGNTLAEKLHAFVHGVTKVQNNSLIETVRWDDIGGQEVAKVYCILLFLCNIYI